VDEDASAEVSIVSDLSASAIADVDEDKYQQIVDNLLSNAIKYTPAGGTITVTLENSAEELIPHVKDTGRGMSREEQRQAFDRFYRAKTARKDAIQGFGVGLSIVEEIVEAHHGTIIIDSALQAGTTMTVQLPQQTLPEAFVGRIEKAVSASPVGGK
jgi:signal transduction histidine kinase